jgi:hypothetical protein
LIRDTYDYSECVNKLQRLRGKEYTYETMDVQQEVAEVKRELANLIVGLLQQNKIEVTKAQKLAADFLATLPVADQEDLLAKLKVLGDNYEEVRGIYLKELTAYNESMREEALHQIRAAIAQGNMDHAITVAKQVREGGQI